MFVKAGMTNAPLGDFLHTLEDNRGYLLDVVENDIELCVPAACFRLFQHTPSHVQAAGIRVQKKVYACGLQQTVLCGAVFF